MTFQKVSDPALCLLFDIMGSSAEQMIDFMVLDVVQSRHDKVHNLFNSRVQDTKLLIGPAAQHILSYDLHVYIICTCLDIQLLSAQLVRFVF